jgi:dihydrofolate reductase
MSKVVVDMGISLDGFVAGTNAGPQNPLGDGGHSIHKWVYAVEGWRERLSIEGGETNRDNEVFEESFADIGSFVMGKRMFDEGERWSPPAWWSRPTRPT